MRHPGVPPELRGTYAGLAHPAAIEHLQRLGVTAVELLPVHQFVDDGFLSTAGCATTGATARSASSRRTPRYAARAGPGGRSPSSRRWSRRCTPPASRSSSTSSTTTPARATTLGPTLSLRGHRQRGLLPPDAATTRAATSTSPAPATRSTRGDPQSLQLIMDSLRYWVQEMHVDGFRFDLAATLGARAARGSTASPSFLDDRPPGPRPRAGEADRRAVGRRRTAATRSATSRPLVRVERQVPRHRPRLLAGRRRARWPSSATASPAPRTSSGRTRPPAAREHQLRHRPRRLHAARPRQLRATSTTRPTARTNRDGADDNQSWNHGVEGPTDDPRSSSARARQQRNLLATLLLSQGVPMLLGGDELGRTQRGNNNAYCQDNEISWFDWAAADPTCSTSRGG